uniref:uncharacterized protein LOC123462795 isoform X2 n=1 Tax=Jaculus jaculus TaxID=51337 RepID=UPI001E1B38D3|nr:uncharacterized protein LOC123462795 isoform X2 [Jaculus jaculus]
MAPGVTLWSQCFQTAQARIPTRRLPALTRPRSPRAKARPGLVLWAPAACNSCIFILPRNSTPWNAGSTSPAAQAGGLKPGTAARLPELDSHGRTLARGGFPVQAGVQDLKGFPVRTWLGPEGSVVSRFQGRESFSAPRIGLLPVDASALLTTEVMVPAHY